MRRCGGICEGLPDISGKVPPSPGISLTPVRLRVFIGGALLRGREIDSLMKTPVSVILMFFSFFKPRNVAVLFFYACYNHNQKKGVVMSVVVRSDALAV